MDTTVVMPAELVRNVVIEVAQLPDQDLLLVRQFVHEIKDRRKTSVPRPTVAEVGAEAKRLAAEMSLMSRAEVMEHFRATTERIRSQAIAEGRAIEGDWQGDCGFSVGICRRVNSHDIF